jgi:diguanylate cyclase (GGDEF)-like protein
LNNARVSSVRTPTARAPVSLGIYLSLILTAAFGVAISLSIFFIFRNGEKVRLRSDFQGMAADRAQAIRAGLGEEALELRLLGSYVAAATELAEGRTGSFALEFGRFARPIPGLEPDSQVLFFIPRVPLAARAEFERLWSRETGSSLSIRKQSAGGELARAGPRAEYFPLSVIVPQDLSDSMLGFDLAKIPVLQKAIAQALTTGKEAISTRTGLPLTPAETQYIWHFLAVSRTVAIPGTPAPRGEVVGLVGSAFRIDQLVELSLRNLSPAGIDLEISDPAAPADSRIVYYHKSRIPGYEANGVDVAAVPWSTEFDAGGRRWTLRAFPTREFLSRHGSSLSWILMGAGLLLTLFACFLFAGRLRRAVRIEGLVVARTAELEQEMAKQERLAGELAESRSSLTGQVERLNQRTRDIQLLNELGDTLQSCVSTDEAFPVISAYLPRLLPVSSGALYMHDPSSEMYTGMAEWGDAPPAEQAFLSQDCWALRLDRVHVVTRSVVMVPCRHAPDAGEGGSLCIPLTASGKTIGLFHVTRFPEESHAFALSVADRIGLSLSNLMLRSDLRQLSIHDPLTGLFNRRYMEETLDVETRRAARKEQSIGVIMLDIDHFKSFNDRFGHAAGDELLRSLAALTQAHLRGGDIACRYGGEEFLLILPEATREGAVRRAEDLRQRVKSLEVKHLETALGPVTISLGVAVFPDHGRTRELLQAAADAALYAAKTAGRDRVVAAGSEVQAGDGEGRATIR